MRGGVAVEGVQAAVPESLTPVLVALTGLGDPMVILVLLAGAYWFGPRLGLFDRRAGARLLAVGFTALAFTLLLKAAFGLPRPPAASRRIVEDGAGFPSGHATAAAAAYGGLAVFVRRSTVRVRAAAAASLVSVVAFTRVGLGVHYVVDVVAGVAVGLGTLAAVRRVTRDDVTWGFALATAVGLASLPVAGADTETGMALAGAAGATVAWWALARADGDLGRASLPVLVIGGAAMTGLAAWTLAATPSLPVVLAINGVLGAGVVGLPALRTSRGTALSPTR